MRIFSWNINGVRSAAKAGFLKWLSYESPDILFLQETRCQVSDLEALLLEPFGYKSYWLSAEKKGYSGVGLYAKTKPDWVYDGREAVKGLPSWVTAQKPQGRALFSETFQKEARTQCVALGQILILNCYFPNSRRDHSRLGYKLEFCRALEIFAQAAVKNGHDILICGDYNIAHKEIDLRNPKTNIDNAGFLPEERAWLDRFEKLGFVDTFRHFHTGPDHYTWWSNRPGVREKNVGWRLDYFWCNKAFTRQIKAATIHPDVYGSDHCPVSVTLKV